MALKNFEVAVRDGFHTPLRHAPEDAAEAWKKGAVVIANGGKLAESGADPAAATIVGVTIAEASGVTSTDAEYVPALESIEFEGSIDTSADAGAGASALTDLFVQYGIAKSAGGVWYVDKSETGAKKVVVTGLVDPAGTVQGRVRFRFLNAGTIYA